MFSLIPSTCLNLEAFPLSCNPILFSIINKSQNMTFGLLKQIDAVVKNWVPSSDINPCDITLLIDYNHSPILLFLLFAFCSLIHLCILPQFDLYQFCCLNSCRRSSENTNVSYILAPPFNSMSHTHKKLQEICQT